MNVLDTLTIDAFELLRDDIISNLKKMYSREDIEDKDCIFKNKIAKYYATITYCKLIWQFIYKKEWNGVEYLYVKDTTIDWKTEYDYDNIKKRLGYLDINFDLILTTFNIL